MKRLMILLVALLFAVALIAEGHRMQGDMKSTDAAMQNNESMHQGMHGDGEGCGQMNGQAQMKQKGCGGGGCGMMQMEKGQHMGGMNEKGGCPMKQSKMQMHSSKKQGAMMMVKHLNLNDQQQTQYKELYYQAKLDKIELNADIDALKLKRAHALKSGDFGDAKKLNKALYEKKAALYAVDIELKMKLYTMLDDQQKALWANPGTEDCGK